MSEFFYAGQTSKTIDVFIQDSSSTTGAGLTGLVYNSASLVAYYRKGATGTATAITLATQTVAGAYSSGGFVEIDSTNMPGIYRLDLPNAVIDTAGIVHLMLKGATNMAPCPVRIDCRAVPTNVKEVSDDSTAADNLELACDNYSTTRGLSGTALPAAAADAAGGLVVSDAGGFDIDTQLATATSELATSAQVDALGASSGGAVNIEATEDNTGGAIDPSSAVFAGSVQSGTYASTEAEDGTLHDIDDTANDIDIVYGFDVGNSRLATEVAFAGFCQGSSDELKIKAYDHVGADWEIISTLAGQNGTTNVTKTLPLLLKHTGTGSELGKVYIRFETDSTTPSNLSVDKLLVSAVGIDSGIPNGSSITLTASATNTNYIGENWTLALGGQDISGAYIKGATVTGVSSGSTIVTFEDCRLGAGTYPPGKYVRCGLGVSDGLFTAASAGEFTFVDCYSLVEGEGTPDFTFSGTGGATGINNRGFKGGATYTLDSNCTLSHEVLAGGGTVVTTGGADVEIRGTCRSVNVTMSAAETVQFVGVTGPITLDGTTTGKVTLYGISSALADTTSAATVTDNTLRRAELTTIDTVVDSILVDTDELQTNQGNWLTADVSSLALETSVQSVISTLGTAGDGLTAVADIVWDEAIAGHLSAGSTGLALNSAGAAGDPWSTAVPGAYGAGTAGYILGTNLDAQVSNTSTHDAAAVLTALGNGSWATEAGGTGDHLTAIPWNASWDTEVQSECNDALVAYGTTALIAYGASTHSAATVASAVQTQLNDDFLVLINAIGSPAIDLATDIATNATLIGDVETKVDTANTHLTDVKGTGFVKDTHSLTDILAAGGGGGSDSQLLQSTTIATLASQTSFTLTAGSTDDDAYNDALIVVTDSSTSTQKAVGRISDYTGSTKTVTLGADPAVFVMAVGDTVDIIATHPYLDSAISGVGGSVGSGAIEETLTIEAPAGTPQDGAEVWVTTDEAGLNVVAGTIHSDAMGEVTFMLDAGDYYAWAQKSGVNFTNPQAFTVT